jgi:hypothetical protein
LLNGKGGAGEDFAALYPADYTKAQELKDEYDGMKQDLQELYAEWADLAS